MLLPKTVQPASAQIDPRAVFDVRPIPCRVKHAQIFQRWLDLPVGEYFVLLNDHDPVPLYYQFTAEFGEAFAWEYLERGPEDFRVKITKLAPIATPESLPASCGSSAPVSAAASGYATRIDLDARGLEPPEPLIRILNALESLPHGITLHAITDREPCHLFGEATQRGFRHACHAQPDGSWVTELERA